MDNYIHSNARDETHLLDINLSMPEMKVEGASERDPLWQKTLLDPLADCG